MRARRRKSGHGTFASLQYRNFRLFFYGQLISQGGTWMTMVTQTLLVARLTHDSGIALGFLAACQFGPILLLGLWGGVVADRADKRRLLLTVQTVAMFQSAALGIAVFTHTATLPVIFLLASVQGILNAFDNPTRRAFVVEMVPPELVNNTVSLNTAIMTGSRVFGPAAAGVVGVVAGYGWCFMIDAISYLAVLWGLWQMKNSELFSTTRTVRAKGQIRDGLVYIRSSPQLYVPLVATAIIGTFAFNFTVTLPLYVKQSLHGSDITFTLLFSIVSVGSVIGALATARRQRVTHRQLVMATAAFGLAMCALAVAPELISAYLVALVLGAASVAFMTAATALVQTGAAAAYRGRVLAIQSMVLMGSTPIGGPIVGAICDVANPRVGVAVGGAACLVASGYVARALAVGRRRTPGVVDRTPEPQPATWSTR